MDSVALDWLDRIRSAELESILEIAKGLGGRVLEIGGGTGAQALALQRRGVEITSLEMATSNYRHATVFPLLYYDGVNIPFSDSSFDTIFSSNVLEHVSHFDALQMEMLRVLKPGGKAVHVMPSHTWRIWSNVTHYLSLAQKLISRERRLPSKPPGQFASVQCSIASRALRAAIPPRHGERGNFISEAFYFRPKWWRREFEKAGWLEIQIFPVPLFYTGYMVLNERLSLSARKRLASYIGPASYCFLLKKPM